MPVSKFSIFRPTLRIRHKIILCIYLVLFPVLIVTEGFIYYVNYRTIMGENMRRYQNLVTTLDENISFVESDLMDITTYFCVNDDILRLLSSTDLSFASADTLFWKRIPLTGVLNDMISIKSHVSTLVLYPENGLPSYYVSRDGSVHNLDIADLCKTDLYQEAVDAQGDHVWAMLEAGDASSLFQVNRSNKIAICREIFDMSKSKRLGFLALTIDSQWYERTLRNSRQYANEAICMVDQHGKVMVQVGDVEEDVVTAAVQGKYEKMASILTPRQIGKWYVFEQQHNISGETLYYFSPRANWNEWITSGLILPIILALALLVCIWPLSTLASILFSRPLNRLYQSMNRFKNGDFNQRVEVSGHDEISEISATFNTMVSDLRDLIDRNYVMVLRERESELTALQAQINPHFLYNTLDSLYWQAASSGQENLAEDILSLSELFRLLLSSGHSVIPVGKEMQIISHYLHIQKMRFAKKLDYSIHIQPEINQYMICKLILQPFVENAIVHGLECKDTWGFVSVTGKLQEGMLCFCVEDNGVGMTEEQIETILNEAEDKRYANQRIGHYAIRNVKERLFLSYGDQYVLRIESTPGKGTAIRIEVPAEVKNNDEDDSALDC